MGLKSTKLAAHSASSMDSSKTSEPREGRSTFRARNVNAGDDASDFAPVETKAKSVRHIEETSRFSKSSENRTNDTSLHSNANTSMNKNVNGDTEGEVQVAKEADGAEKESELNLPAKSKSQYQEAEMEAEREKEMEKETAEDLSETISQKKKTMTVEEEENKESEINQKKAQGVGTIDKKALLVIGDENVADESNKMSSVDDDTMEDDDKVQEEREKEKETRISRGKKGMGREEHENETKNEHDPKSETKTVHENEHGYEHEREKRKEKQNHEDALQKARNMAKLYKDISLEIQNIVSRDKGYFKKKAASSSVPNEENLAVEKEKSMSASLSHLRSSDKENVSSNTDSSTDLGNLDRPQQMNQVSNQPSAFSESLAPNSLGFNQQIEESSLNPSGGSSRQPLYDESDSYQREPIQTESFQYSVNHVFLYPSFLEIGITSNFDGVSYCSVFDRKGAIVPCFRF